MPVLIFSIIFSLVVLDYVVVAPTMRRSVMCRGIVLFFPVTGVVAKISFLSIFYLPCSASRHVFNCTF